MIYHNIIWSYWPSSILFLPTGGDDRRVLLWNMQHAMSNGKEKPFVSMKGEHHSNIFSVAFDSRNSKIYSGGNDDQVLVHDLQTWVSILMEGLKRGNCVILWGLMGDSFHFQNWLHSSHLQTIGKMSEFSVRINVKVQLFILFFNPKLVSNYNNDMLLEQHSVNVLLLGP